MSDIVERLRMGLATPIELEAADEIDRLRSLVGLESPDLDLDWNRLRSGDNRALISDHQDVFDMVAAMRDEMERLRAENNVLASLLACWLDPMLQGEDRWAISRETLEQLVAETKKVLAERQA